MRDTFLPSNANGLRLCYWHECQDCMRPWSPPERQSAFDWLRHCKSDPCAMSYLRRVATEGPRFYALMRTTDESLIAQLSDELASGRLRICNRADQGRGGGGGGGPGPAPPSPRPKPRPIPPPKPKPIPPPKPKPKVTVVIKLSMGVACPGHPLPITAVGTPGGGTYAWSISGGDAALVDGAGNPLLTGDHTNLRGLKVDDATGAIREQKPTVSVTYTHPDGSATDSKAVPIHSIEFDVTNTTVTGGLTQVVDQATQSFFGNAPGMATMSTDPRVKLKLHASCPRKAACAANHRVGWLQTMLTTELKISYTNTLTSWSPPSMPIRDIITNAPTFPFYFWVAPFTADQQTQTAHHEDSPGNFGVAWVDSRGGAAAPPPATRRQLRRVTFKDTFTAWLVVQNIEWAAHDLSGSFAYQKHFNWECGLDYAVDTTQPIAGAGSNRCSPASKPAIIGAVGNGKGSNPVLTAPVYNTTVAATTTAVP